MTIIRKTTFLILFIIGILPFIFITPTILIISLILPGGKRLSIWLIRSYLAVMGLYYLFILRITCGITVRIDQQNPYHLKLDQQYIICPQHQSIFETIALSYLLRKIKPTVITRNDLPIFIRIVFYCANYISIPNKVFKEHDLIKFEHNIAKQEKNSMLIFPEGTRHNSILPRRFKKGVNIIHRIFPNRNIMPIALNSCIAFNRLAIIPTRLDKVISIAFLPIKSYTIHSDVSKEIYNIICDYQSKQESSD